MTENVPVRIQGLEGLKQLDRMVDQLFEYDDHGAGTRGGFQQSATDVVVGPHQNTRRMEIAAIARQLDCPRWWQSHLGTLGVQESLKGASSKIKSKVPPSLFEKSLSHGGPESYDRDVRPKLGKLRKLVQGLRETCQEDYDASEPHFRTIVGKATPDEPIFHYERFSRDVLDDLALAGRACEAAEVGQDALAAASVYEFLAGLYESLAAGVEYVSILTKKIKSEARASAKN